MRLLIAFIAAALIVAVAGIRLDNSDSEMEMGTDNARRPAPAAPEPGVDRFGYLTGQTTNKCELQPEQVMSYADGDRLQGSCCSPMDREEYRRQLEGLRQSRGIAEIPADPYDIPVSQAKLLLGYQQSISLTPQEQATYDEAMQMSPAKGPCCCRCWRWSAFEGMSKYLIQEQGWQSAQLANLIHLVDGCGGSHPGAGHGAVIS